MGVEWRVHGLEGFRFRVLFNFSVGWMQSCVKRSPHSVPLPFVGVSSIVTPTHRRNELHQFVGGYWKIEAETIDGELAMR